jgi:hypothetical protein
MQRRMVERLVSTALAAILVTGCALDMRGLGGATESGDGLPLRGVWAARAATMGAPPARMPRAMTARRKTQLSKPGMARTQPGPRAATRATATVATVATAAIRGTNFQGPDGRRETPH